MIQDLLLQDLAKIEKGEKVFQQLRKRIDGDILLFPHKSLGDIYILGIFKKQGWNNKGKKYSLVVVGEKCAEMAMQVGFEKVLYVDDEKMRCLIRYIVYYEKQIKDARFLHFLYTHSNIGIEMAYSNDMNFIECYSKLVFDYDVNINGDIPQLESVTEKEVEMEGIKRNAVIISPYAKSVANLPWLYWMNLVSYLNECGFKDVYTNCAPDENVIPGTKKLAIDLSKMKGFMDYVGCFIGLRSGLCDIISSSKCRKIILYPKNSYFEGTAKFYSLEHIPGATEYYEIEVPNESVSFGFSEMIEYMKGK